MRAISTMLAEQAPEWTGSGGACAQGGEFWLASVPLTGMADD